MWPQRSDLHEFFEIHANSKHDSVFAKDLEPLFSSNNKEMTKAMGQLLEHWTLFYEEASKEAKMDKTK